VAHLVACVKCGIEVAKPKKEWSMKPKSGKGPMLHIKYFSCPNCGQKFRTADKM